MKVAGVGVGLTALVATLAWLVWGPGGLFAAAWFGLLATALQLVAAALVRRWGMGMGLRLAGVVLFAALATLDRERWSIVSCFRRYRAPWAM
ncbi:MAG: hypothetical protein HYW06_04350 [Gemmatimonadetes bacterium]|nr:hypothetical protein [Gemmatimonadota bacterium]